MNISHIQKLVAALVGAATLAVALRADGVWTAEDLLAIGVAFVTAAGVYVTPNKPAADEGQAYAGTLVVVLLLIVVILLATGRI